MPLMSEPLAHVESLLEAVCFKIDEKRRECRKLTAEIDTLDEMRMELRHALEEERKKRQPDGDSESPK